MDQIIPSELFPYMWEYLPLASLMLYKFVCSDWNTRIKKLLEGGWHMRSLERYLEPKFPGLSFEELCFFLGKAKAIISGSAMLQWALGEDYNSDIDIFYYQDPDRSDAYKVIKPNEYPESICDEYCHVMYEQYPELYMKGKNGGDTFKHTNYDFLLSMGATSGFAGKLTLPEHLRHIPRNKTKFFVHSFYGQDPDVNFQLIEMQKRGEDHYEEVDTCYQTLSIPGEITQTDSVKTVLQTFDYDMLRNCFDGRTVHFQCFGDVVYRRLIRCDNMAHTSEARAEKYQIRGFKKRKRKYETLLAGTEEDIPKEKK